MNLIIAPTPPMKYFSFLHFKNTVIPFQNHPIPLLILQHIFSFLHFYYYIINYIIYINLIYKIINEITPGLNQQQLSFPPKICIFG